MPECRWCRQEFEPRSRATGGSPQRFCGRVCREAFHATLHHWAMGEVQAGRVSLDLLRESAPSSINAAERGNPGSEGARVVPRPQAPSAALRAG
jgi:hypothetical protein